MDVVPSGDLNEWDTKPFELIIDDEGYAIGRGVQDDKGPTLLALYALRILKESGEKLNRRARLIIGTDEESDWRGIEAYCKNEEMPTAGFTPDAAFPVIYAEKYHLSAHVKEKEPTKLKDISGGSAVNVVPAKAFITLDDVTSIEKELKEMKQEHEIVDNNKVIVIGKPYHAKDSHLGDNAIMKLSKALVKTNQGSELIKFIDTEWNLDSFAPKIWGGKKLEDKEIGPVTTNVGILKVVDGILHADIDIRVPHPKVDKDMIKKMFEECISKYNLEFKWGYEQNEVYMEKDGAFIQTLVKSYQKLSGDTKAQPIASGGGTYAKTMPHSVAFGPEFPGSGSNIHQANEKMLLEDLLKAGEIYTDVLFELNKLDKLI